MFKEVLGCQGKSRVPKWWPESSGRSLDDDFQVEAFPVKSGRFRCLFGRLQGWLREVWQGQGQSIEVQGSLELQNGGLRALEEAWMTTSSLRYFSVKSGCFLCIFGRVQGWLRRRRRRRRRQRRREEGGGESPDGRVLDASGVWVILVSRVAS